MTASIHVLAVGSLLVLAHLSAANLSEKLIFRRQASEAERESTSAAASPAPERLYPDLPQPPQSNGANHFAQPPTPFVPFGLPAPSTVGSRLNNPLADPMNPFRPVQQPRPMSAAERQQSQSFTSGLGRRLLSMIGMEPAANGSAEANPELAATGGLHEAMRALQNSSVLQQLNNGVQSIYGNLSKMYNSTVQQQLDLLQERMQRETANSTNPWQQRMAQQIPMYFKAMSARVEGAQESLNRMWQQLMQAGNGSLAAPPAPSSRGLFGSFDQLMGPNMGEPDVQGPSNFFNQIGRSFGFGARAAEQPNQPNQPDLGGQLMAFWHSQVQPQVGQLRGQIMRAWRDLTASGALAPELTFRGRSGGARPAGADNSSSELVDSILGSVDLSGSEYSLLEPAASEPAANGSSAAADPSSSVASQLQSRLTAMQRDVNQLWMGLSGALQGALQNAHQTLNPRTRFRPAEAAKREEDPAANEIESKVKDLGALQRDADVVYEVVQQQQQQQQHQQLRPSLGDRFRGFFGNVELEQLPNRLSDSVSRFGTAVGDLWGQIPNRWDSFVQNFRPVDQAELARARLTSAGSAATTQRPAAGAPA